MKGWRRFWARYALQFKNLKKLTANVPNGIYDDWGRCEGLRELLSDDRWEMLEVEEDGGGFGFFGSYFPFSSLRYSFARKRPRMKFVQRVFFRQDDAPLDVNMPNPRLSELEHEENEISEELIADKELGEHRFWRQKQEKKERGEKRTAQEDGPNDEDEEGPSRKKQKRAD